MEKKPPIQEPLLTENVEKVVDKQASVAAQYDMDEVHKEIAIKIRQNRNDLYQEILDEKWKGLTKTIFFSHIIKPITAHGAHLIYAPDELLFSALHAFVLFITCKKVYAVNDMVLAANINPEMVSNGVKEGDKGHVKETNPDGTIIVYFYDAKKPIRCAEADVKKEVLAEKAPGDMGKSLIGFQYGKTVEVRQEAEDTKRKYDAGIKDYCDFWSMLKRMKANKAFVVLFILALIGFKLEGAMIKCTLQNVFMGWAAYNRELTVWGRVGSISLLMVTRLLVSNVFPFTSPAFAFLIARSQPAGEEWMGTFYLALCAMPAGAVIPFLDYIAFLLCGKTRNDKDEDYDAAAEYDQHFKCTNAASKFTDWLPFSWWVNPMFMTPAFLVVTAEGGAHPKHAAAAAVLAGHFMIWAGPATTMYQRKFVPDFITCVLIQPLGLFEDIAVVLATWAGSSPKSQEEAELSLYVFMLIMNVLRFTLAADEEHEFLKGPTRRRVEHGIVALGTLCAFGFKMHKGPNAVITTSPAPSATTTTTPKPLCAVDHTNVKAMIITIATVSAIAFALRILARLVSYILKFAGVYKEEEKAAQQKLDEKHKPRTSVTKTGPDDNQVAQQKLEAKNSPRTFSTKTDYTEPTTGPDGKQAHKQPSS